MAFAILLLCNNRSKAYIQNLVRSNYIPEYAIVLHCGERSSCKKSFVQAIPGVESWFDQGENVFETLESYGIPYMTIPVLDANDNSVVEAVANLQQENLIYSGPGGVILGETILSQGKRFIHAHPGLVPYYKGSTTYYYSMLIKKRIECSIIVMTKDLDAGDVVFTAGYPVPPPSVDFDHVVDPLIRTQTLLDWMRCFHRESGKLESFTQVEEGNTFYIIHPVLKHLAILGAAGGDLRCV